MRSKNFKLFVSLVVLLFAMPRAQASTYHIDKSHTRIGFKVSHLVIATVSGQFDDFKGSFVFDEKSGNLTDLNAQIQTATINTNEGERDKHLRSADFFNTDKFPVATFVSNKVDYENGKPVKVYGDLSIIGVTKPVTLSVLYKGIIDDPWGNKRLIFEANTKINRKDWGMNWNKTLDQGGLAVGDEVMLTIEGEAILAK